MRAEIEHSDDAAEPVPWVTGAVVVITVALLEVGVVLGVYDVVAQYHRLLGLAAVVVVCAGVVPTAWAWRARPVLRWMCGGALIGAALSIAATVIVAAVGMR